MANKSSTNNDIILAISKLTDEMTALERANQVQHNEKMGRLEAIEVQVKYTNGRVTKLEKRLGEMDAVNAYKDKQAAQMPMQAVKVETNNSWDWKTVLAILLTLATAIAGIAGVVK
jgi:hypothetical protein